MNNNQNKKGQSPKKSVSSPASLSKERAFMLEQQRREAIKRRKRLKKFMDKAMAVVVFSLIGLVIALGAIFAYIHIDFNKTTKAPSNKFEISLGNSEGVQLSDKDYFYKNSEFYISLNALQDITIDNKDYADFILHGSPNEMSLIIDSKNGNQVTFGAGLRSVSINGINTLMQNPAILQNNTLFVPSSFFTMYCNAVDASYKGTGRNKVFLLNFKDDFSFKMQDATEAERLIYSDISHLFEEEKPQFISDLSSYEEYMNPADKDEYLFVITKEKPLSSDYIPGDLTYVTDTRKDGRAKQQMRLYAAKALEAMFMEMRAYGFNDVSVTSAYRSYAYQQQLLDNDTARYVSTYGDKARDKALESIALPGTSEHQSGLCADLHNLSSASTAFERQDAYKWLYANCADFGFILRYPKDKTHITGITFEPWHYRYVGRYHAQKIMSQGLCLEEYMETLR